MKNTIVSFVLVLMLVSCSAVDNYRNNNVDTVVLKLFDQEVFDGQRTLWLDQNLQNYSFCLSIKSFPHLPTWSSTVIIKDGIVESASPDNPEYGDEWQGFAVPISSIYDRIVRNKELVEADASQTENKDPNLQYSYSLEIEYDTEYHFPKFFSYTFVFNPKDPTIQLEGNGRYSQMTITNFTLDP
jgi:hypothetical protein